MCRLLRSDRPVDLAAHWAASCCLPLPDDGALLVVPLTVILKPWSQSPLREMEVLLPIPGRPSSAARHSSSGASTSMLTADPELSSAMLTLPDSRAEAAAWQEHAVLAAGRADWAGCDGSTASRNACPHEQLQLQHCASSTQQKQAPGCLRFSRADVTAAKAGTSLAALAAMSVVLSLSCHLWLMVQERPTYRPSRMLARATLMS